MKKLMLMVFLPMALFALEKVNLIKDAGFEKDSEVWNAYAFGDGTQDSAMVSRHSSEKASGGSYSAFSDTRKKPGSVWDFYSDSALIIQGFYSSKDPLDFDSLTLNFSLDSSCGDPYNKIFGAFVAFYLNAGKADFRLAGYIIFPFGQTPSASFPEIMLGSKAFSKDTLWDFLSADVNKDLQALSGWVVDSFFVRGSGFSDLSVWRGQKIYWDDIRLTGYADYDVGIKGLLSGDSVWKSTAYTPTARIKNFGRKAADTFLVIAEIEGGSGTVYADTLPYALPADTEDTLSFKEFTPPDASNYTLTVRTEMTPDESDEDDEMSKTLYGSGIVEPVTPTSPSAIQLEITALSSIRYSIPSGEQGTISLYDPSGRRVESKKVTGSGEVRFNAGLASGIYFVKLEAGKTSVTRKAVVLR